MCPFRFRSRRIKTMLCMLLALCWGTVGARVPPLVVANVSYLLAQYHNVDCVQIFRPEEIYLHEIDAIHVIWKNLAVVDSKITTGIYSFKFYVEEKVALRRKVSCYNSLKIMVDDERSRRGYAMFSVEVTLKDAIWVLFTDSFSVRFFDEAHVEFDDLIIIAEVASEEAVEFYEVYRVQDGLPLRAMSLGKWTKEEGLMLTETGIHVRRSDLEGIVLRTASVQNWPAVYRRRDGKWDGFLVKLWKEIWELLNCTSVYVEGEEALVGAKLDNGTWNGLVGMATRNEIDVIVAEVILNKERTHVLKFLHPIIESSFQIYTRDIGYEWRWFAILKPLDLSVWVATFGWAVVGAVAWVFFHHLSMSQRMEDAELEQNNVIRSFFFVGQALCQQGYHVMPRTYGCRVLFFVTYAISSVLIPSYSASLVSTLSQKVHLKSFDSLREMVNDGSYYLLVKENTAQYAFFAHSKDPFLRLAYEKLVKPVPQEMTKLSIRNALRTLCERDKYAVMGIEDVIEGRLRHLVNIECPIVRLTHPVTTIQITMATGKQSPFSGLINYHLSKLIVSGAVERFRKMEFPERHVAPQDPSLVVGIRQVATAFIFIFFSVLLSAFILLLEIHFFHFTSQRNRLKRKIRPRPMLLRKTPAYFPLNTPPGLTKTPPARFIHPRRPLPPFPTLFSE